MGVLALLLFISVFVLILVGFPVAFTLGGVSIWFGLFAFDFDFFYLIPLRTYGGAMQNIILMAVPLFIFMGVMLEKSGIAVNLLKAMAYLFGRVQGGLAISVVIVGTLLAASTGIVGATVVTMGLLSLPTMLKSGYHKGLATGTIAASGTLGQIIPPSIVLVLLASVLNVSVGALFTAAVLPALILVFMYIIYIVFISRMRPDFAPSMSEEERAQFKEGNLTQKLLGAFVLPMLLIVSVLGSIIAGIASPTEAAAIGAFGASLLTIFQGKFTVKVLQDVMKQTSLITSMVFMILIGANAFGLVFRGLKGDDYLISLVQNADMGPHAFLALVMCIVFVAGFFIDFIEITFIIVPVVAPIFKKMGIDLEWIGILLALNLQTSFLTPPFGFALFYLKGVAPPNIRTKDIYKGVIPFIIIQIILLALLIIFPDIIKWLPEMMAE